MNLNNKKKNHFSNLKYWYKRNARWLYLFLGITLLPPILFNLVILIDIPYISAAQDNDWIGFFGSFLGSIIGGALTLIGVRLTITSQEDRNFIDAVPKKLRQIDTISKQIESLLDSLITEDGHKDTIVRFTKDRIDSRLETLLDEASLTDAETYNYVHSIKVTIKVFFELNWENTYLDDWGTTRVLKGKQIEFIAELKKLHEGLKTHSHLLRKHRSNLSKQYFNLVKK